MPDKSKADIWITEMDRGQPKERHERAKIVYEPHGETDKKKKQRKKSGE